MTTPTHDMRKEAKMVDWDGWLCRWDAQQMRYSPEREEFFMTMFEVIELLLPDDFVALDLASGPGSISQRLLARFPRAQCIAVDNDPVLLTVGRNALGTVGGRLRWIEADIAQSDWSSLLDVSQIDVVLSANALHWL